LAKRFGQASAGGTNYGIIGMEGGTNFCKTGQTSAEIRSKMAEILREGTNFGKNNSNNG
jgi:hypothetical protein